MDLEIYLIRWESLWKILQVQRGDREEGKTMEGPVSKEIGSILGGRVLQR